MKVTAQHLMAAVMLGTGVLFTGCSTHTAGYSGTAYRSYGYGYGSPSYSTFPSYGYGYGAFGYEGYGYGYSYAPFGYWDSNYFHDHYRPVVVRPSLPRSHYRPHGWSLHDSDRDRNYPRYRYGKPTERFDRAPDLRRQWDGRRGENNLRPPERRIRSDDGNRTRNYRAPRSNPPARPSPSGQWRPPSAPRSHPPPSVSPSSQRVPRSDFQPSRPSSSSSRERVRSDRPSGPTRREPVQSR